MSRYLYVDEQQQQQQQQQQQSVGTAACRFGGTTTDQRARIVSWGIPGTRPTATTITTTTTTSRTGTRYQVQLHKIGQCDISAWRIFTSTSIALDYRKVYSTASGTDQPYFLTCHTYNLPPVLRQHLKNWTSC